ncbi:MAG: family 16 glycoside hydrolase [Mucilaginibacter sp.]
MRPLHAQDLQKQYTVVNRSISTDAGSIHLNEVDGDGKAWINGKSFTNGTIEFDIKGKDKMQGSFVGFAFHGLNDSTYEAIYFRPFNFRSTDPVRKGHAVQYIASPKYDWPTLRNQFPNKYEQPISPAPDPEQWFHVRITVENEKISVYVNNSNQPSLTVVPLVKTGGKMIGYWVGNTSGGDWKNLKLESRD